MHTRKTSDYSPTRSGSKAENAAIVARAEMMKVFSGRDPAKEKESSDQKWQRRMYEKAHGFDDDAHRRRHQEAMARRKEQANEDVVEEQVAV